MSALAMACVGTRLGETPPADGTDVDGHAPQGFGLSSTRYRLGNGARSLDGLGDAVRRRDGQVFQEHYPIERRAQPVDGVDALVHVRAVRSNTCRLDLDPQQAFFAEADHHRRADVTADIGVATRLRNVLEQVAGAERAHILLVASKRQDHLAAPGMRCSASSAAARIEQASPPFISETPRP